MNRLEVVARRCASEVEQLLNRSGLLFRVFFRAKEEFSLAAKLNRIPGKYSAQGKRIQDAIGIRVAVYFADDVPLVRELLCSRFEMVEVVQDDFGISTFAPMRLNVVFRLSPSIGENLSMAYELDCVDDTFEVQIRTILSEGWHEVEHDLRYKHQEDWLGDPSLGRTLNGILATIETCEWATLSLFSNLAHRHYRTGAWAAMLRSAMRLRFLDRTLSVAVIELLNQDSLLAKAILQFPRKELIGALASSSPAIPITLDNACHVMNTISIHNAALEARMPDVLRELFRHGIRQNA